MISKPIKVLIVEDTKEHAQLLEHILAASSYPKFQTVVTHSLAGALEKLRGGGIDAILLDLTLPDSIPSQTFRAVNEVSPDIAVVVISGIADVSKAIELVQAGAQDYLIKGQVDHNLLLRSIHYSVERKRNQVALRQAHDQLEARVHERTAALVESNTRLQNEIAVRRKAEDAAVESNRKLTKALEDLHAAQQELVSRERLNALGKMANGIAHEFNNVLTPIIGWTEHLLHKPEEIENNLDTRNTIQKIQSAATVGAAAVGRVRDFARNEADAYVPVSLATIIEQAVASTQPQWSVEARAAGIMIEIRKQLPPVPEIHGEASQLRELVTHLIINAVRAIPRRGSIAIGLSQRGNQVALSVRDDGLGMNDRTRERCLDPNLGSMHPDGHSSSYGFIHGILQRHDGQLEIESEEGRGSKITVLLPVSTAHREPATAVAPPVEQPASQPQKPVAAAQPPLPSADSKKRRILIAEDDSMVREVMYVYLSEDGYEVTTASNGREGVEAFAKDNGAFDLFITDRAMPEMGGDQVALEAKRINPSVPVILLTGFGELMNSEGEKPPGVDLVVGKPFTIASLREALRKVGL